MSDQNQSSRLETLSSFTILLIQFFGQCDKTTILRKLIKSSFLHYFSKYDHLHEHAEPFLSFQGSSISFSPLFHFPRCSPISNWITICTRIILSSFSHALYMGLYTRRLRELRSAIYRWPARFWHRAYPRQSRHRSSTALLCSLPLSARVPGSRYRLLRSLLPLIGLSRLALSCAHRFITQIDRALSGRPKPRRSGGFFVLDTYLGALEMMRLIGSSRRTENVGWLVGGSLRLAQHARV